MRPLVAIAAGFLMFLTFGGQAFADSHQIRTDTADGDVTLTAGAKRSTVGSIDRSASKTTTGYAEAQARQAEKQLRARVAEYQAAFVTWQVCVAQLGQVQRSCSAPTLNFGPRPPADLTVNPVAGGPPQIAISAEQVAYIAIARLHLEPLKPVIGPPPDLNPWHMAAVGYPLWLSGAGTADPAPVTDAVFNLVVSLDAHVTQTDFVMGDGQVVTCRGAGVPWSRSVAPGEKSPSCGYQYSTPSLPDASYTVIARTHWDVDWTINNQRGVIRMVQTSSVQLPVGELQVLVR